ncbi:MAG: hypothetical protein OXK77_17120 [Gemmatimonadota bacterium]|nr:hypothetical protein [Gemmatimonadota bacterium]MDE2866080.1 hypothetical protein [Gemmatimonadota bacterium]
MADPSDSRKSKRQARDPFSRYLKSISGRRGPGFLSLLALLFIGLKLTGHIDWSWVWVLSPLWFRFLFVLLMIVAAICFRKKTGWEPSGET